MSIAQSILANPEKYSLEQLTQGVENGVIPAYIGVPIIQEMMQRQAQTTGMQDEPMPPVMDQVMAQAAQGLEALPSNLPQEYADGGIIAFDQGGLTQAQIDAEIERARLANQAQPSTDKFADMRAYVDQFKSLMPEKDPRLAAYEASIMKTPEQLDARKNQDLNLALAQFGLGLMGSKNRTLLGGIGEAGNQVLPSVQAAMLARRTADDTALRAQADLARGERAEGIAALQGGLGLYGKAEDRISDELRAKLQREATLASSNKPTDMVNFVNTYVRNAQANPENKKSADTLALEGFNVYFVTGPKLTGQTLATQATIAGGQQATQQNIATGTQDVTVAGQGVQANIASLNAYNKALETRGSPEFIENRRLKKLDKENAAKGNPSNLAEAYKNSRIQQVSDELLKTSSGAATPPAVSTSAVNPFAGVNVPPGATPGKKTNKGTEVIVNGQVIGHVN